MRCFSWCAITHGSSYISRNDGGQPAAARRARPCAIASTLTNPAAASRRISAACRRVDVPIAVASHARAQLVDQVRIWIDDGGAELSPQVRVANVQHRA